MAARISNFDVWFVAANTVYKGVPFNVVAEWVQGGRLAAADRLRPAKTEEHWHTVAENELLADYLPRSEPKPVKAENGQAAPPPSEEPEDFDIPEPRPHSRHDEDDDPDMIPLIDISLVLLIFFMMIRAAGALSPVDVPDMQFAGELSKNADTLTIAIEKKSADEVVYSVRLGEQAPTNENSNLPNLEAAMKSLDAFLSAPQSNRPPDVRVACEKALPNGRVCEVEEELKKRKKQGVINAYDAEVNEKAKP